MYDPKTVEPVSGAVVNREFLTPTKGRDQGFTYYLRPKMRRSRSIPGLSGHLKTMTAVRWSGISRGKTNWSDSGC